MVPVRFLSEAATELVEAQGWYDTRAFGLGDRFHSAVDGLVERISLNPHQFPVVHAGIRRALVPRFPYGLFFRVEPDGVFIVACRHAGRAPLKP